MELIISRNLIFEPAHLLNNANLLLLRPLSRAERQCAKTHNINRQYLVPLNETQKKEFFLHFDRMWEEISSRFKSDQPFWRNGVSSKMQEWDKSFSYFCLILYSLKMLKPSNRRLCVLCRSIEEESVLMAWARLNEWTILKRPGWYLSISGPIEQIIKNLIYFARQAAVHLKKKLKAPAFRPLDLKQETLSTLLISMFYPSAFREDGYCDPFMGHLHRHMQHRGYPSLYIADALSPMQDSWIAKMRKLSEVSVNMPHALIAWPKLMLILFKLLFRRIQIDHAVFMGCDLAALIRHQALSFVYGFNFNAEVFYEAIKEYTKNFKPDKMILLYEGNAFERGCIQAFKEHSQGQICGYSHGVVFEANLKLRVTAKEANVRPMPDTFVCTGRHARDMLARFHAKSDNMKEGCSLRLIPQVQTKKRADSKRSVLIALDGVHSAAGVLDWLIDNKDCLKGYEVYYRTHPNVPVSDFGKYMLNDIPAEFKVSDGTLEEAISQSVCVLYRHTSIGIQALLNGVPAIHLAVDSPLNADPIEPLASGRFIVAHSDALKMALAAVIDMNGALLSEAQAEARNFVEEYFASPTGERINQFIG